MRREMRRKVALGKVGPTDRRRSKTHIYHARTNNDTLATRDEGFARVRAQGLREGRAGEADRRRRHRVFVRAARSTE
jgi:hypothetical protein